MGDLSEMAARVSLFVMIETAEGLANVEEIAQVPGLAGIYVGPADLSIGLGLAPMRAFTSDQLDEPLARIRKACQAAGIVLGMHQANGTSARRWIERGVRLATLGGDAGLFGTAAQRELEAARGRGAAGLADPACAACGQGRDGLASAEVAGRADGDHGRRFGGGADRGRRADIRV